MIQIGVLGSANLRSAQKRMSSVRKALELAPRGVVYRAALLLRAALKEAAPVKTGELRRSIGFRSVPTPSGYGAVFHAARHAIFVISGTRPHQIWAGIFTGHSDKRALFWPGASHPVSHVNHPGTRANDFRKKAWVSVGPEVRAIMRETGSAIFRGDEAGAGRLL